MAVSPVKHHKSTQSVLPVFNLVVIFIILIYFNSAAITNIFTSSSTSFNTNLSSLTTNPSSFDTNPSSLTTNPSSFDANLPSFSTSVECEGRYIYIHDLPPRFNEDLLRNCESLNPWTTAMCRYVENLGLGPKFKESKGVFKGKSWYSTNQFSLEVIFHNRMKNYPCLTRNSSMASAIYVPYYAGLDVGRFLWNASIKQRDELSIDLVNWLKRKPEWKSMLGKDHFLVAGRVSWDFRRRTENNTDWGNKLLLMPELKNMTTLVIESSPWYSNDIAIPYPTYFHPWNRNQVVRWQRRVRKQKRRYLFSFAGAPRPQMSYSIRNQIINQCLQSSPKCKLLRCDQAGRCDQPTNLMNLFRSSIFCLQPPGDSYTRRSAFDSILAGCIPVFFHPGSAYTQYLWHLPRNHTDYSVFIDMEDVRKGKVSIEKKLSAISKAKVAKMREEVVRLIPKVIYAHPAMKGSDGSFEDAFDLAVRGFLNKTEQVRNAMKAGMDSDSGVDEEFAWKYRFLGDLGNQEWDSFPSGRGRMGI